MQYNLPMQGSVIQSAPNVTHGSYHSSAGSYNSQPSYNSGPITKGMSNMYLGFPSNYVQLALTPYSHYSQGSSTSTTPSSYHANLVGSMDVPQAGITPIHHVTSTICLSNYTWLNDWIVDSGVTDHITTSLKSLENPVVLNSTILFQMVMHLLLYIRVQLRYLLS